MSLRHPGQNPGRGQGYLSQDSRVVPPPRFAGCRRGSAAAQSEQERLIRADAGWDRCCRLQYGLQKPGSTRGLTAATKMRTCEPVGLHLHSQCLE